MRHGGTTTCRYGKFDISFGMDPDFGKRANLSTAAKTFRTYLCAASGLSKAIYSAIVSRSFKAGSVQIRRAISSFSFLPGRASRCCLLESPVRLALCPQESGFDPVASRNLRHQQDMLLVCRALLSGWGNELFEVLRLISWLDALGL